MNLSRRAKARLLVLASMTAPVLGAQTMRLMGAGGPASSLAMAGPAGAPAGPVVTMPRRPEPTAEQTRALQWLALRDNERSVRCPMEQPVAPPPPLIPDPTPTPSNVVPTGPDPLTTLTVTSIMARDEGGLARINGKLYSVGSSPMPGWKISLIDSDKGLVELTDASGKVVRLVIKRPDSGR